MSFMNLLHLRGSWFVACGVYFILHILQGSPSSPRANSLLFTCFYSFHCWGLGIYDPEMLGATSDGSKSGRQHEASSRTSFALLARGESGPLTFQARVIDQRVVPGRSLSLFFRQPTPFTQSHQVCLIPQDLIWLSRHSIQKWDQGLRFNVHSQT